MRGAPTPEFTQACKDAEFYETDPWAAEAILDKELMTRRVLDPCAGRGVLGRAARGAGYDVVELDLNDWPDADHSIIPGIDYLKNEDVPSLIESGDFTVMMNPPFSLACQFVDRSFELGARKVLMFQRLSWMESSSRRDWFERSPPARVWICGDRATCWRGDVPEENVRDAGGNVIVKGKKGRSVPTTHAWFVWERGHKGAEVVGRIWKPR